MKFSYVAIGLGAASVVSAQSAACASAVDAIPACGTACINSSVENFCSSTDDYACECASSTFSSIQTDATQCVIDACKELTVAAQVLTAVNNVCAACA